MTNTGDEAVQGELTASFNEVKVAKQVRLAAGESVIRLNPEEFALLKVLHARLWWPNGYGEPALQRLKVSFTAGSKVSAQQAIEFGMRVVSYETSLLDSTDHLRRVEVFPRRTHDLELPLINESHEGIRQIAGGR